jgi:antitoxin ParD1/3/4
MTYDFLVLYPLLPKALARRASHVTLTDELDRFVLAKVESGRYDNASEVVRAALRKLEREEREYEGKV